MQLLQRAEQDLEPVRQGHGAGGVGEQEGAADEHQYADDHHHGALDALGGYGEYPPVHERHTAGGVEQVQHAREADYENQRLHALEQRAGLYFRDVYDGRRHDYHHAVAQVVPRGEERGDEDDDPDELRARVQAVDYGVPREVLAEGYVLQHCGTPSARPSTASRRLSSV